MRGAPGPDAFDDQAAFKLADGSDDGAGIERFGVHSLRHSYCSLLDAIGTPVALQQKLMRHATLGTTMSYGDVVTDQESEALAKIAALTIGKQHAP